MLYHALKSMLPKTCPACVVKRHSPAGVFQAEEGSPPPVSLKRGPGTTGFTDQPCFVQFDCSGSLRLDGVASARLRPPGQPGRELLQRPG